MHTFFRFIVLLSLLILWSCNGDTPQTTATTNPAPPSNVDAISVLSEQIASSPNNAALYFQRGTAYYDKGMFAQSIPDFQRAIVSDSTQVPYFHALADAFLDDNQSRLALETMRQAGKRFPTRIPTLLKLSEFELILKQNQSSLRTLHTILKIDPQNAEAFFMLGLNFKELGDDSRAINSFQTAVENNPDLVDGWLELGYLFEKSNNPVAERYFDNALRVDSTNVIAIEAKGNYLGGQGKFSEAIETYKKIHRLDRNNPNAYYNVGLAYLQMDSIEQAYRNFDISIKVDPVYLMGYYYRGVIHEMRGNNTAAKQDYEQALRLNPDFERAKEALEKLH